VTARLAAQERASGTAAILVVMPSQTDGDAHGVAPTRIVIGLPLITRVVLAATAAGYDEVLVHGIDADAWRVLRGTAAVPLAASSDAAPRRRSRIVVLPANVIPQPRWLERLRDIPLDRGKVYVDGETAVVIDSERPEAVLAMVAAATSAPALTAAMCRVYEAVVLRPDDRGRFRLAAAADAPRAQRWLLRSLIKQNEGFMSRHVERPISLALTRQLARTSISPNAMTLVSVAIGLAGAPFFLSPSPPHQTVGALMFLTHSILDGCDGELARLKFLRSRLGAVLDFWGDNVVHVAVFTAMAIGWTLDIGATWPLALGALASAGTLGSAAVMFRHTAADEAIAAGATPAARLAGRLAHRDFIYVVLLASLFGKASWFLAVAAVGTPAFLLLALWLDRVRAR
jgi:1L-myo-inositol 1-phosphate cytidylyltransferase / CDP-L-myo-inositol myo-inositolphosphotransferase